MRSSAPAKRGSKSSWVAPILDPEDCRQNRAAKESKSARYTYIHRQMRVRKTTVTFKSIGRHASTIESSEPEYMYRESFVRTFISYDSSHSLSNDCADSVRCPQSPSRSSGSNDLMAVRMRKSNHVEKQISVAIRAAQIGLHIIHQKMVLLSSFTLQILELD